MATDLAKRETVELALRAFGDVAPDQVTKALTMVQRYGFNPYLHLTVYQKRIAVTVDGMYHWVRNNSPEKFDVVSKVIPAHEKEQYGVKPYEIGVIAEIYRRGEQRPACTGFGRASTDKQRPVMNGSAVEAMHPYRMAEKRAEAQALRKFLAIGDVKLPEDLVDSTPWEEEIFVEGRTIPENVDGATGEIKDDLPTGDSAEGDQVPNYGSYSDWENVCPDHGGEIWIRSSQYAPYHRLPAGSNPKNCYLAGVTQKEAYRLLGEDAKVKDWLKQHREGKTWRDQSTAEQLAALATMVGTGEP